MLEKNIVIEGLTKALLPYKTQKFDSVVLGCTHFPFAVPLITKALGYSINFFDGSILTARQTMEALKSRQSQKLDNSSGSIRFMNSMNKKDAIGFAWKLFSTELQSLNLV